MTPITTKKDSAAAKGRFYNYKVFLLLIVGIVPLFLTGCATSSPTSVPTNNIVTQTSAEDSIKDVLRSYYSLLGQRKIGEAYQYVATASNISQKDYVDYQSGRGLFVNGFKNISYNYVQVHGDTADTSVTIAWSQVSNSITGDTYNQESTLQMVKEAKGWRILWKKVEDSASNTNANRN